MINLGTKPLGDGQFVNVQVDVCRVCKGTGLVPFGPFEGNIECTTCAGTGKVMITRNIKITVEPYKNQSDDSKS